jgi:Flp pilus assembly protein TadD
LYVEDGDLPNAVLQAQDLIQRHPDSAEAHYILSYALRYAGVLEESAQECDKAFTLDAHTQSSGLRSCSIVFALRGDYARAGDYLNLDPASDFYKAMRITTLLRAGRKQEALRIGAPHIPQWTSYDLLTVCVQDKASPQIAALAASVPMSDDPEANYLAAANLAYCGRATMALSFLKKAIEGNYCSYPAMDSDPFFANVRAVPDFAGIRAAGMACQQKFLAARQRLEHQTKK